MYGRKIILSVGAYLLTAEDYSISGGDKLAEISFEDGTISNVIVGTRKSEIDVSGEIPCSEAKSFTTLFKAVTGVTGQTITLDGNVYADVTLDKYKITPSEKSGFASYSLKWHF